VRARHPCSRLPEPGSSEPTARVVIGAVARPVKSRCMVQARPRFRYGHPDNHIPFDGRACWPAAERTVSLSERPVSAGAAPAPRLAPNRRSTGAGAAGLVDPPAAVAPAR
jgi:hypothetical protein